MPRALSTRPDPYQHEWRPGLPYDDIYTGWAYPPKDYAQWAELVYQWVRHCVERYGEAEVETWYWETWNEANIGYWQGTPEEFLKLHDHAIAAVRRALPGARVGGPDMAGSDPQVPPEVPRALPRPRVRPSTSSPSTPRGSPGTWTATSGWGSPPSSRRSTRGSRRSRRSRSSGGRRSSSASPTPRAAPPARGRSSPTATGRCTRATPPRASPASTTWPRGTA